MPGRPKTSDLTRRDQLVRAKRAQRHRLAVAGEVQTTIALPADDAQRLRIAKHTPEFRAALSALLDDVTVRVSDYPQLLSLSWSIHTPVLTLREAFAMYERNWRLVNVDMLIPRERAFIERLAQSLGNGVIHG